MPDAVVHFEPNAADEREAEALCAELGLATGSFAIVHPANAVASERGIWPLEGWSSLVREIGARFNLPVLVSGSEDDRDIVEGVVARGGGFSIAGKTSIGSFGALSRRAAFFAGITTGAMHVAAACGCPTAGIFLSNRHARSVGAARRAHRDRARQLSVSAGRAQRDVSGLRLRGASRRCAHYLRNRRAAERAGMKATIQLCTYNRARVLERVLDACFEQTVTEYEVVLVNDGSIDDTPAVIAGAQARATCPFTVVSQPNGGLAKARNAGLARSTGERIILIDDDVLPLPNFVEEHLRSHARHPKAIVRGAAITVDNLDDLPPPFWSLRDYSGNYLDDQRFGAAGNAARRGRFQ